MAVSGDQPLNLLFYIPALIDGGAERVMSDLASGFARDGNEVMLVVDFQGGGNAPKLEDLVQIQVLDKGHLGSVLALARLIRRQQPDIAIAAIASANFKLSLAHFLARLQQFFLPRRKRSRLVLTYHGFEEHKTGWLSWLGLIGLPLIGRWADRVVAVSDALRDDLQHSWRASSANLMRIHNPVHLPVHTNPVTRADLAAREKLVLSVGRLVPTKRFDLLIKGFAKLPDEDARLIILGEGPERDNLQALIDQLGLSERVQLPGYTTDTASFYAKARCFALTSPKESFGLVLVEALSHGVPVVSTDNGGAREVLDNGRFGILLAHATSDELAEALAKKLADPGDPAPRLERAAEFSFENGLSHYRNLFETLASDS
jgi:glycosyltransferase involved in cell wall biosynthesis